MESATAAAASTPQTSSGGTTIARTGAGGAAVATGPVRGALTADNHAPTVGTPWHYSVSVSDAAGHSLSGSVEIEFAFAGQIVGQDTPPTHPLRNGSWRAELKFPPDAIGQSLTFVAVVNTKLGSVTLDWPITVQR